MITPDKKTNILFLVLDGFRGDLCYGKKKTSKTPNIDKLIKNGTYFQTTISLNLNANRSIFFSGVVEGKISNKPRGQNGFGYDPIFVPNGMGLTFSEMSLRQKNLLSHRAIAIKKLSKYLTNSI